MTLNLNVSSNIYTWLSAFAMAAMLVAGWLAPRADDQAIHTNINAVSREVKELAAEVKKLNDRLGKGTGHGAAP